MKKLNLYILGALMLLSFILTAQTIPGNTSISLGNAQDFFQKLNGKSNKVSLQLSLNKSVDLFIYKKGPKQVLANLNNGSSLFRLGYNRNKQLTGFLIVDDKNDEAYKLSTNQLGELSITPASVDDFVCRGFKGHQGHDESESLQHEKLDSLMQYAWDPYDLNSKPGAKSVIYCDFDGYNLPAGTPWNNGAALNAAGTGWSDIDMLSAWYVLVEDYSPFEVNITTNEAVYNTAPNGWKTRVVFTPTSYWSPGGGVALLGSFLWDDTQVCWVFTDGFSNSVRAAEAGSHEAGHTVGLKHDGSSGDGEYYKGHDVWSPIMGVSYYLPLTQWSLGDYANATNTTQDDTWIIQDAVGGYRTDDHGNTIATASEIDYTLNQQGIAELSKNKGIIETRDDKDVFHFYIAGGAINLRVEASGLPKPNLDFEIELLDAQGNLIELYANSDADFTQAVTINKVLAGGDYYLRMDGVGPGNPSTKWTDYGSLGQFQITGTIEGIQQKDNDAAVMGIQNIDSKTCGNSLSPEIEILNGGALPLSQVDIIISLNSIEVYNQIHLVNIESGKSGIVTVNDIPLSNFGDKTIDIQVSNPNGVPDEIPSNNSFSQDFNIQPGQLFQFDISLGSLEPNMTWSITDNTSEVLNNTTVSISTSHGLQTQQFCLEEDKCYDFQINQAFLEDLCNMYSEYNQSTIYNIGDKFVFEGRVYEANTQIWSAPPNLYSQYYNDLGPCPEPTQTDYFNLENKSQSSQLANVTVAEYNGTFTESFCVDITTTSNNLKNLPKLSVFPNPFLNELHFSFKVDKAIIIDGYGKTILTTTQSQSISISENLPAGIYIVEAMAAGKNHWFKVIKKR